MPIGSIFYFAASTPPDGFLECNGSVVSSTVYPALATLLGTTYGAYAQLPDLRGEFIRGWTNSRIGTTDDGRVFGSWEADQFQGHIFQYTDNAKTMGWSSLRSGTFTWNDGASYLALLYGTAGSQRIASDGVNGIPRVGTETRSRNIALLPCIRAIP